MNKFDCVLFDLDGTLIDTTPLILESFKHTFLYHYNIKVKEEELMKYLGIPLKQPFEELYPDAVEALLKTYKEFNEYKHDMYTGVFTGIARMLEGCRREGTVLGVVTSKRRDLAERGMRLFDLQKYMDIVVTMEDTTVHKPKGDPVKKALELLGLEASDSILYVGDSTYDILCAKDAGVMSAAVAWSYLPLEELHAAGPDILLEKPEELLNYIRTSGE